LPTSRRFLTKILLMPPFRLSSVFGSASISLRPGQASERQTCCPSPRHSRYSGTPHGRAQSPEKGPSRAKPLTLWHLLYRKESQTANGVQKTRHAMPSRPSCQLDRRARPHSRGSFYANPPADLLSAARHNHSTPGLCAPSR
jgi:hypothetical protein